VPLILALYGYCREKLLNGHGPKSVDALRTSPAKSFASGNYVMSAACLSIAYSLQTSLLAAPRSTYIYPISSSARFIIPWLQLVGCCLDGVIASWISNGVRISSVNNSLKNVFSPSTMGYIFLVNNNPPHISRTSMLIRARSPQLFYLLVAVLRYLSTQSTGRSSQTLDGLTLET